MSELDDLKRCTTDVMLERAMEIIEEYERHYQPEPAAERQGHDHQKHQEAVNELNADYRNWRFRRLALGVWDE